MSREDVVSFLHTLQLSIDNLQRRIDQSIHQLQNVKTEDLSTFVNDERQRFVFWHQEQLNALENLSETISQSSSQPRYSPVKSNKASSLEHNNNTNINDDDNSTPFGIHLQSLEQRVAAMGGIPALGSVVLPRNTITSKPLLKTTSSAAAVEILRTKLDSPSEEYNSTSSPLLALKKVGLPDDSKTNRKTEKNDATISELAAVLQKRADKRAAMQ